MTNLIRCSQCADVGEVYLTSYDHSGLIICGVCALIPSQQKLVDRDVGRECEHYTPVKTSPQIPS